MKKFFLFLVYLVAIVAALVVLAYITGNGYLVKGVRLSYLKGHNSANIYDGNDFDVREIKAGKTAFKFPYIKNPVAFPQSLKDKLKSTESTSLVVIKNDSIVWEEYYDGHDETKTSNSFSMAKTVITMLVEKAIEEKKISSWDEKVIKFLPWLQGPYAGDLTFRNLSTMTAGIDWQEAYTNPFCITAKAYYGDDILSTMKTVKVVDKPGEKFVYQSGCTQLLGLALKAATGKNVADYASEKLWQPLQMEKPAYWHLDNKDGMELTYCCINAISRDYAKLGKLWLHKGNFNGTRILDSSFFNMASQPFKSDLYGYAVWLGESGGHKYVLFQGILGQFIAVVPDKNIVLVRTGHKIQKGAARIPDCIKSYLEETLKVL